MNVFEPQTPKTLFAMLDEKRVIGFAVFLSASHGAKTAQIILDSIAFFYGYLLGKMVYQSIFSVIISAKRIMSDYSWRLTPQTLVNLRRQDKGYMVDRGEFLTVFVFFFFSSSKVRL